MTQIKRPDQENFTGYHAVQWQDTTIQGAEAYVSTFQEASDFCEGWIGTIMRYENGDMLQWWVKKGNIWHDVTGRENVRLDEL